MASSYLSDPQYNYDFVVAVTQESINAELMNYLDHIEQPLIRACYVATLQNGFEWIEWEDLQEKTGGIDPFDIPDNTDASDPRIAALIGARFVCGFKARLGLPNTALTSLPDLVTLGKDTQSVTFRTLCSEFVVVAIQGGLYTTKPVWTRTIQDPSKPWVFLSEVDLSLSIMEAADTERLSEEVRKRMDEIRNLSGSAFDIQQLSFDLASAKLRASPTLQGFTESSPVHVLLQSYFLANYVKEMELAGKPVLGCCAVSRAPSVSTLTLTGFSFHVNPYVGADGLPISQPAPEQTKCTTLNYLCAANHNHLPPTRQLTWNWVDTNDIGQHDGVLSINRNAMANYFKVIISPLVPAFCIKPDVSCWLHGSAQFNVNFQDNQLPQITLPSSGENVLSFTYGNVDHDQTGVNGTLGQIEATYNFSLQVAFKGTQIIITQQQVVHVFIQKLATKRSGDVINNRVVDTYSIGIDENGGLVLQLANTDSKSDPDKITTDKFQDFWTHFNNVTKNFSQKANVQCTSLKSLPLGAMQNYVFPGGRTFAFANVCFSDHQDLVATIKYADPTADPVKMAPLPRSVRRKTSSWGR